MVVASVVEVIETEMRRTTIAAIATLVAIAILSARISLAAAATPKITQDHTVEVVAHMTEKTTAVDVAVAAMVVEEVEMTAATVQEVEVLDLEVIEVVTPEVEEEVVAAATSDPDQANLL